MELFFDTETTDVYNFKKSYKEVSQPRVIQLGFILSNSETIFHEGCFILRCDKKVQPGALALHHISDETISKVGLSERDILTIFMTLAYRADTLVCHNVTFDIGCLKSTLYNIGYFGDIEALDNFKTYCTMFKGTSLCKLSGKIPRSYKWPKLQELHNFLFNEDFSDAHSALGDIKATRRCYYEMINRGIK